MYEPTAGTQAERAGFVVVRIAGSHYQMFNERTRRHTTVPLHNRDLPRGTISAITRQAALTRDEFLKLLCMGVVGWRSVAANEGQSGRSVSSPFLVRPLLLPFLICWSSPSSRGTTVIARLRRPSR